MAMNMNANHSIKCSVGECEFHCGAENYCSLDCVNIGTHESNPTLCQCVDCESFKVKDESGRNISSKSY